MFPGSPYDNVMIEAIHELYQGLRAVPAPLNLNLLRRVSAFFRQRRAVVRLSMPENTYPTTLLVEEECA